MFELFLSCLQVGLASELDLEHRLVNDVRFFRIVGHLRWSFESLLGNQGQLELTVCVWPHFKFPARLAYLPLGSRVPTLIRMSFHVRFFSFWWGDPRAGV